jgi:xanthine dehydrogenase accessory factor
MRFILDTLIEVLARGESVVLGTIVRSSGSTPRTSGARMLMQSDGTLTGTIGGGAIEAACQKKAQEIFDLSSSHAEVNFSMSASTLAEGGMVCGGTVSVLLQMVDPGLLDTMRQIRSDFQNGEIPIVLTVLPSSLTPPRLVYVDKDGNNDISPDLKQQIFKKIRRAPFLIKSGEHEMFVEALVSPGVVYLMGAGHVALATAHLASFAGFDVVVMDDRAEYANKDRFPEAQKVLVLDSFDDCLQDLSSNDYIVIVTRGHIHDRDVLAQALRTKAGYIGMIGSRKKRNVIYDSLREDGFSDLDLKRVHSPIGISIGADTPNEIALSIVSELVKARSER